MEHLVGGFSYVRQNHIVLPKLFPEGKINTHELVQRGYNWFYENSLSNKNCNLRSASESPFFCHAFYPSSSQTHTPSVLTTLRPLSPFSHPHLLFLFSPLIIPMFATNFFPVPISFYLSLPILLSLLLFFHPTSSKSHTVPCQFLHVLPSAPKHLKIR